MIRSASIPHTHSIRMTLIVTGTTLCYLGETHFPRYFVEMECHSVNTCRDNNNDITVRLLKRLDGCSEEGFEKWSNSYTTPRLVMAGRSCRHVPWR